MTTQESTKGTLELTGSGEISVVPDVATLRLSIVTQRKTAAEAVSDNATDANAVIDKISKIGIPREDMQTEGLNLYPVYETNPQTNVTSVVGYRASNTISVTAPIDLAGKVFDAGVESGVDESSGLSFGMRDPRPHREKALEIAVAAARKEAELVARAMGVQLLGPKTVQVLSGGGPIRMDSARLMAKAATPVLPGSLTISATVQVVWNIAS